MTSEAPDDSCRWQPELWCVWGLPSEQFRPTAHSRTVAAGLTVVS
jgi:hypothetical protein